MKQFRNRAAYFELEQMLDENQDFHDKIQTVKNISQWASNKLGLNEAEAAAYSKTHIAHMVRENQPRKMLRRIEDDLFNKDIDVTPEMIVQESTDFLKDIQEKLLNVRH